MIKKYLNLKKIVPFLFLFHFIYSEEDDDKNPINTEVNIKGSLKNTTFSYDFALSNTTGFSFNFKKNTYDIAVSSGIFLLNDLRFLSLTNLALSLNIGYNFDSFYNKDSDLNYKIHNLEYQIGINYWVFSNFFFGIGLQGIYSIEAFSLNKDFINSNYQGNNLGGYLKIGYALFLNEDFYWPFIFTLKMTKTNSGALRIGFGFDLAGFFYRYKNKNKKIDKILNRKKGIKINNERSVNEK